MTLVTCFCVAAMQSTKKIRKLLTSLIFSLCFQWYFKTIWADLVVDHHPFCQLLEFTGKKIYIGVSDSSVVAVVLKVVVSLCPLCEHPITWKTELVHGQNPPLKPPLLRVCVACPSTAEIPALPPPPASDHHRQCPSRVFPAPGCAAAAGWAAGCLLLGRLWGGTSPDTNAYWLL